MDCFKTFLNPEIIKIIAYTIVYHVMGLVVALKLAQFHFEKGLRERYLLAKDKVATDITNYICVMLKAMWEMVNIDGWIASGNKNPDLPQKRQQAYITFHSAVSDSYATLGQMGLYFDTGIVEMVSQLQSDLNSMVNKNNFEPFTDKNWDNFRRKRLLPIMKKVNKELRYTVFQRPFWDLF